VGINWLNLKCQLSQNNEKWTWNPIIFVPRYIYIFSDNCRPFLICRVIVWMLYIYSRDVITFGKSLFPKVIIKRASLSIMGRRVKFKGLKRKLSNHFFDIFWLLYHVSSGADMRKIHIELGIAVSQALYLFLMYFTWTFIFIQLRYRTQIHYW